MQNVQGTSGSNCKYPVTDNGQARVTISDDDVAVRVHRQVEFICETSSCQSMQTLCDEV